MRPTSSLSTVECGVVTDPFEVGASVEFGISLFCDAAGDFGAALFMLFCDSLKFKIMKLIKTSAR